MRPSNHAHEMNDENVVPNLKKCLFTSSPLHPTDPLSGQGREMVKSVVKRHVTMGLHMAALREHRIFGPPGTGKTTTLTRNIVNAAGRYGHANVFVASFTRAAAAELTSRVTGFPRDRIGTLHSHGYRAIGAPPVIKPDTLKLWNEQHPSLALPLDLMDRDSEQRYQSAFDDDDSPVKLFSRYDLERNRLAPPSSWPDDVQVFGAHWEAWKRAAGVVDYTDMIEQALSSAPVAPGAPQVGFFDETQDFTPLELALVRKWGSEMEQVVLAGDDDQMIYGFKGASVDAFLDGTVEPASVTVLKQSYRVPEAVHRAASRWISQVRRRQPKPYLPRRDAGAACALWDVPIDDGEGIIRVALNRLQRSPTWTVMILVDAARMLHPVIASLREAGLPYHNPYAERRGDWNPLGPTAGVSGPARLLALSRYSEQVWGDEARPWSADEVARWAEPLRADGVLVRGGKKRVAMLSDDYELSDLAECFVDGATPDGALDRLGRCDLDWYASHLTGTYTSRLQYPLTVARKRGVRALEETPRIIVGTIHSAKGGEADTVILCPDLSYFRQQDLEAGGDLADDVRRLFYVGMTRARHELLVTAPSGRRSLHPHDLLGVA